MQLVFVHGSGGCRESWKFQTDHFENSEAVNLPGHPDGDLCPTIEEYVKWLHEYIHGKGYTDVVLTGHSLGGGIALQYALEHPEDLKGIVLAGSGARLRVHPKILEMLENTVNGHDSGPDPFGDMHALVEPGLAAVLNQRAEENGPASFLNDLKACDRFDVMERLGEIKTPVMALCGDKDMLTPPKYSQFLADAVPGTQVVIIPGGTHMAYAEKPAEANQAIEKFLAQL